MFFVFLRKKSRYIITSARESPRCPLTRKVGRYLIDRILILSIIAAFFHLLDFIVLQVFVGNIPPETEVRDLRDFFRDYGVINDCWVARKPPGFGFVWFDSERDAVYPHSCADLVASNRSRRYCATAVDYLQRLKDSSTCRTVSTV